jgi:hypothetical protein
VELITLDGPQPQSVDASPQAASQRRARRLDRIFADLNQKFINTAIPIPSESQGSPTKLLKTNCTQRSVARGLAAAVATMQTISLIGHVSSCRMAKAGDPQISCDLLSPHHAPLQGVASESGSSLAHVGVRLGFTRN